jgi:pilus assembly protein Flp/PilA
VLKLFASTIDAFRGCEDGQTMAEYGVILAVVALAVVASLTVLSGSISTAFENVGGILPG